MAEIRRGLPPLRGVFHAAGILDDGMLVQQDWRRFERVLAPKIAGAWNLHLAAQECPLEFFVLYSSAASLLGPPGQGNYAAANSFMDALAHYRRFLGQTCLTVNWGPWSVGMSARLAAPGKSPWAEWGMDEISPKRGLAALDARLESGVPQVAVLPIDWTRFVSRFGGERRQPLLEALTAGPSEDSGRNARASKSGALRQKIGELPEAERYAFLQEQVHQKAAWALGLDPRQPIDPRRSLLELGLDSLSAVELRNRLAEMVGLRLPATLLFDQPTIEALSAYLAREGLGLAPETDAVAAVEAGDGQPTRIATEIENLSEDELKGFIERELEKWDEQHER